MLHSSLKIIQARAAQTNKAALEAEKARDELHNQIQQIEEQLQPKRARTDDDAGDAHEMLADFLLCFLVYRGTMRGGHIAVGVQHARCLCAWSRTRIQLLWTKSHGARLYAHQADLFDRRRIYCHIIIRDSES